ncbi:uncharacterized protein LOC113516369 isoform X2 [Galleria mellonella]|uniref:Uncharacterized protein LOC113516369 isoform X2 n=1 Tax=Galleria mellonella TaxID=7137 RepID=A0ABM3MVV1_GALME|nr:uncharacterized protein LOC113516369 isoform X2 [Galleria mellonella]
MLTRAQLAELPPQPGASPGLMRRRYSVPETIMRKYRLAQQKSDSEESGHTTSPSPASASPPRGSCSSLCDTPHRFMRRDRELMRKSALLRRMWGRSCNPCQACCCCSGDLCDSQTYCGRETRSLDGSRSELRHLSSSFTSSRQSHAATAAVGWATPKRLRRDSPRDFRGSDEMLRAAMKNSYDRAEESRFDMVVKTDQSGFTCRSYCPDTSSHTRTTEAFIDNSARKFEDDIEKYDTTRDSETVLSDPTTAEIDSNTHKDIHYENESQTDTSESLSMSMPTTKEINDFAGEKFCKQISNSSAHIEGRISERSMNLENNENNILSYDTPLAVETPAYDLLEIVVSETLNSNSVPAIKHCSPETILTPTSKVPTPNNRNTQNINIDEYVSNILVESLNSLTDQIECMNASIGRDRKVSIVEKEIKVKLQNTGVNTIVHLSPMSNNQIIFGNEELYNNDENKDNCNNPQGVRDRISFHEEIQSMESNNNLTSGESLHEQSTSAHQDLFSESNYNSVIQHDNVNKAVLQQIQKLFQDELCSLNENYSQNTIPEISHIEISNVDVYVDNNADEILEATDNTNAHIQKDIKDTELISNVGAGNYFQDSNDNIVPRFSALPHTDSMEVNTSSSDDADNIGSDCTSLVDSLDDPNSPRSILLRRSFNTNRRNELARSAIDVLDLLPENSYTNHGNLNQAKEKGESFFIRIKDNNFDCEKENMVVADHMPEKIKQRLYRRHKKREMRLECARRSKVKQLKKDLEKQRHSDLRKSKKELEKDCMAIINALIDDVIAKIARDEHKYMRIKQKCNKMSLSKSDENVSKRNWKKDLEYYNCRNSGKCLKNNINNADNKPEKQIHGKLSLLTHPPITSDERGPRRFYQKSEIQDGNKCIEILEILEYVNESQSSPDITNSDDSQGNISKNKKSRIPVPIYERIQKTANNCHKNFKSNVCRQTAAMTTPRESNTKSNRLITNMLLEVLADNENGSDNVIHDNNRLNSSEIPARRASVPHCEPRSRSNSLKFKQVFDIIPEERSSLSIDSSNEDIHYSRRASAPNLIDELRPSYNKKSNDRVTGSKETCRFTDTMKYKDSQNSLKTSRETKCTGTSPLTNSIDERNMKRSQTTMTSPSQRSAATSPIQMSTHSETTSTMTSSTVSGATTDTTKYNSQSSTGDRAAAASDTVNGGSGVAASGKRGLASRSRAWLGFTQPEAKLHEEGLKEKNVVMEKNKDCRSVTTQYDRELDTHRTVRTIQTETFDPIIVGGDKYRDKSKSHQKHIDMKPSRTKMDKKAARAKSESRERNRVEPVDGNANRDTNGVRDGNITFRKTDKRKIRTISMERSEEETVRTKSVKLPEFKQSGTASSSDSSESGGSLLCSLAPKWLSTHARHKRAARRRDSDAGSPQPSVDVDATGSCRAALPADVEMRLRFPSEREPPSPPSPPRRQPPHRQPLRTHNLIATSGCTLSSHQEWRCRARQCTECTCTCCGVGRGGGGGGGGGGDTVARERERDERAERRPPPLPPAAPTAQPLHPHVTNADSGRLTFTMKKEALGSSILATKSEKKSNEPLPDLETYRASRSKTKSSVKTRRGYSLHCWLPDDTPTLLKTNNGLSILGSAIIPELKPRVPTMSERDLTRVYTPRHYLRS